MIRSCSNVVTATIFPQRRPLAKAVALVFALGGGGSAQAATIEVTSNSDDNTGGCTLREAIQAANTNVAVDLCTAGDMGADTITFADNLDPITLTGMQIDITEALTIQGNPATGQVIDGGAPARTGRIFGVTVADVPLTLENLTLQNSRTTAAGIFPATCTAGDGQGGAVCTLGDLTLENSTVAGNTAGSDAGGLFVDNNATLTNSTVSDNMAAGGNGGGLFVGPRTTATLTSTILANNTADGAASDCESGSNANVMGNNNLVEATGALACNLNGSDNIFNMDPDLEDLADNGCAVLAGAPDSAACVQTHALNAGSMAIDNGSNPEGLTTDQRGMGFARELGVGPQADIGAYETGTATATLTLLKNVINDEGGSAEDTDWTLSFAGPTSRSGTEGQPAITSATIPVGNYTLSESGPAGYQALGWRCPPDNPGTLPDNVISLSAGEDVTCEITNDDTPPIPVLGGWGLLALISGLVGLLGWRSRPQRPR